MRNKIFKTILCLAILFAAVRCAEPKPSMAIIDGFAQGSTYHIVIDNCDDATQIKVGIEELLDEISASMSLFDEASLINALNNNDTDSLDTYIADCIEVAHNISVESGGHYDITIKPLVQARGFLAGDASQEINIDSLLQFVGYQKIKIENRRLIKDNPSVEIDLSSIAQGYSVDLIADYLSSLGFENFLVELGGEIMCRGERSEGINWRVGIDRPTEGNILPGNDLQIRLGLPSGRGLATSGNYRKFYLDSSGNKVVHTISPISGQSVISELLSATVIAENATLADAYGTLFMVLGLEQSKAFLESHPRIDAYIVYGNQNGGIDVFATQGMQDCIID